MLKVIIFVGLLVCVYGGGFGFRNRFGGGFGGFGSPFGGGFGGFGSPFGGGFGGFGSPFGGGFSGFGSPLGGFGGFARSGNQNSGDPDNHNLKEVLRLCTFSDIDQAKCSQTIKAAQDSNVLLRLECVQKADRNSCLQEVKNGVLDMVILGEHDYRSARDNGLKPALYARTNGESRYIAVIPKSLKIIDLETSPIVVDETKPRAFHAAILFNLFRDHDICPTPTPVRDGMYINIVDSVDYEPNDDEVLICPNKTLSDFSGYKSCNFEASLQRAIFVPISTSVAAVGRIYDTFETILKCFNNPPNNESNFVFFGPFNGTNDVLFKDDTNAFDVYPSYQNFVTEQLFQMLHCANDKNEHSPKQLE